VKRNFGNWIVRLFRGATLTDAEFFILRTLVESLDVQIRGVVQSQFDEYNLVQREVDGRALNFYKIGPGGHRLEVSTSLEMENDEEPLVKVALAIPGEKKLFHAVLTAVGGRAFCVTLERAPPSPGFNGTPTVTNVIQSWRSGVRPDAA
jgi:hypothetical protein